MTETMATKICTESRSVRMLAPKSAKKTLCRKKKGFANCPCHSHASGIGPKKLE